MPYIHILYTLLIEIYVHHLYKTHAIAHIISIVLATSFILNYLLRVILINLY